MMQKENADGIHHSSYFDEALPQIPNVAVSGRQRVMCNSTLAMEQRLEATNTPYAVKSCDNAIPESPL